MTKKEKYEAVVEAKGIVAEMLDTKVELDDYEFYIAGLLDDTFYRAYALERIRLYFHTAPTMRLKVALFTVLTSGTVNEGGGFNMPATKCCLENFEFVRRKLNRGRKIPVLIYDDIEDRYHTEMF